MQRSIHSELPSGPTLVGEIGGRSMSLATLFLAGLVFSLQSTSRRANGIATMRTAELATSEERFRHAFDFAGTGLALVGLDGQQGDLADRPSPEIVGPSRTR